jgi:glutaredoxin-like protein
MSLIPEERMEHLKSEFGEKLEKPVKIIMFTQEVECQFCSQTRELINQVAGLSPKIQVETYDFLADTQKAKDYGVDKVPAIVITGEKDYGVRFYGLPFGYELQTLIEGIINVSKGRTDIPEEVKLRLKEIKTPVHVQVFVTLTCPHCAKMAAIAHEFAVENEFIKADVIDTNEFPHFGLKYNVMGVPKTIINEKIEFIGVLPEDLFLEHILLAII